MNVYFDLPDSLKKAILDEWLAYANIDYAQCFVRSDLINAAKVNNKLKAELTRLINMPECVFQCHVCNDCDYNKLSWIVANGVKVRSVGLWLKHLEEPSTAGLTLQHLAPTLHVLHLNMASRADIATCRRNESHTISPVCNSDILQQILKICLSLKELKLQRSWRFPSKIFTLEDTEFDWLQQHPSLEVIEINDYENISAAFVRALCLAKHLRQIVIGCSSTFAEQAMTNIPCAHNSCVQEVHTSSVDFCRLFPNLVEVDVTKMTNADVVTLAVSCNQIKTAHIHMVETMMNATASRICTSWPLIKQLFITTSCAEIIAILEGTLSILLKECTSLIVLRTVSRLANRTSKVDTFFAPYYYPPMYMGARLRDLSICCGGAQMLETITVHCPYLHSLTIVGNRLTSPQSTMLDALHLLNSTSVRHLCIDACAMLSDDHISTLRTIESLHFVHIWGEKLTNTGIVHVAKECTSLHALHLGYTQSVTAEVGLDILHVRPTLHTFTYTFRNRDSDVLTLLRMVKRMLRTCYPQVKTFDIICE